MSTLGKLSTVFLLLVAGISFSICADDIIHFRFSEDDFDIVSSGNNKASGKYIPSCDPDNDTPETRDTERFRKKGKYGGALAFFNDIGSYGTVKNSGLPASFSSLYIGAVLKQHRYQRSVIVAGGDGLKNGFVLFMWGREWRLWFGDGKKIYRTGFKGDDPYKGGWKEVEVFFDKGTVILSVNGKKLKAVKTECQKIVMSNDSLIIGNEVKAFKRKERGYLGLMDELAIATSAQSLGKLIEANTSDTEKSSIAFSVLCEPVEGNEMHFGGKRLFNTFAEFPVPLNFLFTGDPQKLDSPKLNLYLPAGIELLEAYQTNHNLPDQLIKMSSEKVDIDGMEYFRMIPIDLNYGQKLSKGFRKGNVVGILLGKSENGKDSGKIYWSTVNAGVETEKKYCTVNFIAPPPAVKPEERGRFYIMNYFLATEMSCYSPELFEKITELYMRSGLTGKGRWYKGQNRRARLDEKLLEKGFILYDIALWSGPARGEATEDVPLAIGTKGKPFNLRRCPTALLESKKFREDYIKSASGKLYKNGSTWVALDYEPWGVPGKICFCDRCMKAFAKRFSLPENISTLDARGKYKKEWTIFWTERNAEIIGLMCAAARKANPEYKVVEYTYFFDFSSKENLLQRQWSIPKDPRLNEKYIDRSMLSAYHINDRELFDMLNISLRHLKKSVSVIASLSRPNAHQGSYTKIEESLSPQRLSQKAIMCASCGVQTFGLWPGFYIDGAFHLSLSRATQTIWKYENFFYDGERADKSVDVIPDKKLQGTDYAYTVFKNGDSKLISIFNFTDMPIHMTLNPKEKYSSLVMDDTFRKTELSDKKLSVTIKPRWLGLIKISD